MPQPMVVTLKIEEDKSMSELAIYTIYENPKDYPGLFVVRRWEIMPGSVQVSRWVRTALTINQARALLPYGVVCLPRNTEDDPSLVGSWI